MVIGNRHWRMYEEGFLEADNGQVFGRWEVKKVRFVRRETSNIQLQVEIDVVEVRGESGE